MAARPTTKKPPVEAVADAPQMAGGLTGDALKQLRAPFTPAAVKFKPQAVAKDGTKALATFYIDARLAAERLNAIVGPDAWEDTYRVLFETNAQAHQSFQFPVECALTVYGVTKVDVGVYMQGNTADDKAIKSAYSDALKRAAVKFGIGAYLYALPKQWFPFERGPNGKGGKWTNEAAIRKAYEQACKRLGLGDPIDHGDLSDPETQDGAHEVVTPADSPPEQTQRAEAEAAASGEVKRDGRIHVTDKEQIVGMVNLAREAGYTEDEIKKVLDNERAANGGHYRKKWLTEQLQDLNTTIAERAAA